MSLSDAELDQIEERAQRASPSPWEAFVFPNPNDQDFIRIGGLDDAQPDMYIEQYVGAAKLVVPTGDMDFIAHARQDVPALVAEIRRLKVVQRG
jgi:hypothetical protein